MIGAIGLGHMALSNGLGDGERTVSQSPMFRGLLPAMRAPCSFAAVAVCLASDSSQSRSNNSCSPLVEWSRGSRSLAL